MLKALWPHVLTREIPVRKSTTYLREEFPQKISAGTNSAAQNLRIWKWQAS